MILSIKIDFSRETKTDVYIFCTLINFIIFFYIYSMRCKITPLTLRQLLSYIMQNISSIIPRTRRLIFIAILQYPPTLRNIKIQILISTNIRQMTKVLYIGGPIFEMSRGTWKWPL